MCVCVRVRQPLLGLPPSPSGWLGAGGAEGGRGQRHYTSSVSAATGRRKESRAEGKEEEARWHLPLAHSIHLSGGGFIYKKCEEREGGKKGGREAKEMEGCAPSLPPSPLTRSLSTLTPSPKPLEDERTSSLPFYASLAGKSNATIKKRSVGGGVGGIHLSISGRKRRRRRSSLRCPSHITNETAVQRPG